MAGMKSVITKLVLNDHKDAESARDPKCKADKVYESEGFVFPEITESDFQMAE